MQTAYTIHASKKELILWLEQRQISASEWTLTSKRKQMPCFNIFVRQSLREGGIPFAIKMDQPNQETIAAMLEAERIARDPSVKGYTDLDELFADLKK